MTQVYFVRHAQSDHKVIDQAQRPLTEKGMFDRQLVTKYLKRKSVDAVFSSPYKRAYDTVKDFADSACLPIYCVDNFRERRVENGQGWIVDFFEYAKMQWADFDYKLDQGESLREVQKRNIDALVLLLNNYRDRVLVIGTHGTALCTIINYFDNSFEYDNFLEIAELMPWIVKMTFVGGNCTKIEQVNLFTYRFTESENE